MPRGGGVLVEWSTICQESHFVKSQWYVVIYTGMVLRALETITMFEANVDGQEGMVQTLELPLVCVTR